MPGRTCRHCATPLRRKAKAGPWPRYCSATCRARASDARAAESGRADQWAAASKARKQSQRANASRHCAHCQVWFTPLRKGKTYCSSACRTAAFGARRRSTQEGKTKLGDYQRTRSARTRGDADAETFTATDIFERDGWVCGLCHEPIPRDVPKRHPMSASLDHVIPLSLGGEHSPENTQAAHLVCNGRKGNRTAA